MHSITCISLLSHIWHMPYPFYGPWFDHTLTMFGKVYKPWSSLLCNSHQPLERVLPPFYAEIFSWATYSWVRRQSSSLSSSLCTFLHSTGSLSLLGPNILLSTVFSKQPQLVFLLQSELPCFTLIQNNRQNYSSVYLSPYIIG